MNYLRSATERGNANFGWLDSYHSFSFGGYYDPEHMGVSALRVINDDTVAPAAGFDTHGHRDMEIISYVLDGAVRHEDSMGNQYVVPAGDVQVMSAGTGVMHSEFNDSETDTVHFLQIWITPRAMGTEPRYQQKRIEQHGKLTPLVTSDGREGSLMMQQDAAMYRLKLDASESIELESPEGYLHLIEGALTVTQQDGSSVFVGPGDGFGFNEATRVLAEKPVHALFFDLPERVIRPQ